MLYMPMFMERGVMFQIWLLGFKKFRFNLVLAFIYKFFSAAELNNGVDLWFLLFCNVYDDTINFEWSRCVLHL
jgi:hypothetical protein